MKGKDYIETQLKITSIAQQLEGMPLEQFLQAISKAETLAPVLDPTLYLKAAKNLQATKNLAKSLLHAKLMAQELRSAVIETAAMGFMSKESTLDGEEI